MKVEQISVFLENKSGRLAEVTEILPWNLPVSFGFACFLLVAFWLFWAWRRRPIVATGLLWFVLALAPALAALPVNTAGQFVLAERWLYTASAGMMLALAATAMPWLTDLGNVARVRRTGAALLAWASRGLGALLWITPIWESNTTLYRYLLHRNPTALGPLINVATLEMQAGQPEAAMALVQHAVAKAPGDATAWLNLGMALRDLRRYDEAMAAFRTSVQLNPAWIIPPMYMSSVYFDTGRYAEGIALMRAVVRRAPMFASPGGRGQRGGGLLIVLGYQKTCQNPHYFVVEMWLQYSYDANSVFHDTALCNKGVIYV